MLLILWFYCCSVFVIVVVCVVVAVCMRNGSVRVVGVFRPTIIIYCVGFIIGFCNLLCCYYCWCW